MRYWWKIIMSRLIAARAAKAQDIPSAITVSIDTPALSVDQGASTQAVITISPQNYTRDVSLAASSVPSGVTVTFSTPTPQSATILLSTMTVTAAADATPVSADTITITATGTGVSDTVDATVTVVSVASPAITLSADDATVSVLEGSTVTINLTVARLGGFTGTVTLAVTGLPTGVTGSFSDSSLSSVETTSVLTLTSANPTTPVVDDAFTITASGSGVTDATVNGTVTVVDSGGSPIVYYRQSNWGQYADTAALIADQGLIATGKTYVQTGELGVSGNGSVTIDPSVQPDGVSVARFRYHAGSSTKPTIMANSKAQTDVWIAWEQRWTPGFCVKTPAAYTRTFAHKLSNFGFSGVAGRLLSSITNCGGTPGASSGNNGNLVFEMMSKTGSATYCVPRLRNAIDGASSLFHDGEWYKFIVRWTRVDQYNIRAHIWFTKRGDTPNLLCTIRIENRNHNAGYLKEIRFLDTWNAFDTTYGGGAPDSGVDQSIHLRYWEIIEEAVTSDPYGCGLTVGTGVTISGAFTPDDTPTVVRSGSSVTRTLTVTKGASMTGMRWYMKGPTDEPGVGLPTGLTVSWPTAMIASNVNTATITISASGSATPGTYTVNLFAITAHEGVDASLATGVGAAVDCIPLTVTVT